MEQLVTIELFGQSYTFKTNSDVTKATEVAERLAKEVASLENQQEIKSSQMTKLTIMILAALNIANENLDLKRNHSELMKDISQRSANLILTLDASEQQKLHSSR